MRPGFRRARVCYGVHLRAAHARSEMRGSCPPPAGSRHQRTSQHVPRDVRVEASPAVRRVARIVAQASARGDIPASGREIQAERRLRRTPRHAGEAGLEAIEIELRTSLGARRTGPVARIGCAPITLFAEHLAARGHHTELPDRAVATAASSARPHRRAARSRGRPRSRRCPCSRRCAGPCRRAAGPTGAGRHAAGPGSRARRGGAACPAPGRRSRRHRGRSTGGSRAAGNEDRQGHERAGRRMGNVHRGRSFPEAAARAITPCGAEALCAVSGTITRRGSARRRFMRRRPPAATPRRRRIVQIP